MTPQEAKKELMHINLILAYQMNLARAEKEKDMLNRNYQANNIAISALEKQIPKKVITHTVQENCKIGARIIQAGTQIDKCPICESFISKINKHCGTCGQALDWGNE